MSGALAITFQKCMLCVCVSGPKVRTEAEGSLETKGQELGSCQTHSTVTQAEANPDPKPEEMDFPSCKEGFMAK